MALNETFAALDLITVCWVTQTERQALMEQGLQATMPNEITFDDLLAGGPTVHSALHAMNSVIRKLR